MSANNDSGGGGFLIFLILLGLFAYIAYLLFLLAIAVAMTAYAIILYVSIILTVVALFASIGGIHFFNLSVSALHARLFLVRGLLGAMIAPSFVWFASSYYGFHVADWLWPHLAFGGYAMLSTGVFFMGSDGGASIVEEIIGIESYSHHQQLAPPSAALPSRREDDEPQCFRFATWDDEEELRGK